MIQNEMLYCLIALIIGYLVAKEMSINGFTIGGKYSCSGIECIVDEDGTYDNDDCDDECKAVTKYSCSGTKCIEDVGGEYDNDDCDDKCKAVTKYSCSGTKCIEDVGGEYDNDDCDDKCPSWLSKYWWIFLIIGIVVVLIVVLFITL